MASVDGQRSSVSQGFRLVAGLAAAGLAVLACDGVSEPSATAPAPVSAGAPAPDVAGDHVAEGRVRLTPPRAAFFRRDDNAVVRFAFSAQVLDSAGKPAALAGPPTWSITGDGASRLTGRALSADRLTATAETETGATGRDVLTVRHGSASGRSVVTSWEWVAVRWQGRDWVRQGGSDCVLAAVVDRAGKTVPLSGFHELHGVSLAPEAVAVDSLSLTDDGSVHVCVRGVRPGSGGLALSAWDTTTFRYGGSWRRQHVLAEPLRLEFAADEWELGMGQAAPLALQVVGSQGNAGAAPAAEASVSSSSEAVAVVEEGAAGPALRGVASGSAALSASYEGWTARARVDVHEIVGIRTGGGVTCLLMRRGTLRCAGEEGPLLGLGRGRTNGVLAFPDAPDVPMGGSPVVALGRGLASYAACGVQQNGDLRCWGSGFLGYGDGNWVGLRDTPADKGAVPIGGRVRSVGVAGNHACAVMEGTGAVRCWGANHAGQLGYASSERAVGDDETPASFGDVPLGGRAVQVEGGRLQTCALMETGKVRCWGIAAEGWDAGEKKVVGRFYGLGYGERFPPDQAIGDDETPASVGDLPLPGRAVKISVGGYHACALMAEGTVRCWGSAWWGVLGDGERGRKLDHIHDAAESEELVFSSPVVDLVSHYFHNCVLLADHTVRCWGNGDRGSLGYGHERHVGDDEPATFAPPVPLGGPVAALALHYQGGCAAMRAGGLRCWGDPDDLGFTTLHLGDDEAPAEGGNVQVFAGPVRRGAGGLLLARGASAPAPTAWSSTWGTSAAPAAMVASPATRGPLFGPTGVLAPDSLPPLSTWKRVR